MDNESLNPKIEAQAQKLCREISVAHDLDEEIQEELLGHVEDKLLAYLGGNVPLSVDDAFLLTKNHFGDTALIKSLFHDVHTLEVTLSLGRRLGAAAIVALACSIVAKIGLGCAAILFTYLHVQGMPFQDVQALTESSSLLNVFDVHIQPIVGFAILIGWAAVTCLVPLSFFRRWKKALAIGKKPWFYTGRSTAIGLAILVLVCVYASVPSVPSNFSPFYQTKALLASFLFIAWGFTLGQCVSWVWWCDNAPRSMRNSIFAAGGWSMVSALATAMPFYAVSFGGFAAFDPFVLGGRFLNTDLYWGLSAPEPFAYSWTVGLLMFISTLGASWISMLLFGAVAVSMYFAARYALNQFAANAESDVSNAT
jgi:hypothetical protein